MHDHAQPAASNKGINPGRRPHRDRLRGLHGRGRAADDHVGHAAHARYFDPDYYQGKVPVFDPKIFGTTVENYEKGWPAEPPAGGAFDYPTREQHARRCRGST